MGTEEKARRRLPRGQTDHTHRQTLPQHAGLLELPRPSELLHVPAEVAVSALGPDAGLAALAPGHRGETRTIIRTNKIF